MIIKGIVIVLLSIVLINMQVRLVRTIFPQKEEKHKVLLYTLLMGAFVASALVIFSQFISPYIQWYISYRLQSNNIAYSVYVGALCVMITSIFASKKYGWIVFIFSSLIILTLATWLAGFFLGWIWRILLKATWEEVLKTSSRESLASGSSGIWVSDEKKHFKKSANNDIIIYSILSGLWFALFENIVYFVAVRDIGHFVVRSITTSLLHGVFTGVIWFLIFRYAKGGFISYLLAYCIGIWLHTMYNISLENTPLVGWLAFTIGWYFLLAYLLYKSDSLYTKKNG